MYDVPQAIEKGLPMNICYGTDDNFCMLTGISMLSVMAHTDASSLVFHVLDAGISEENYRKLESLATSHSAKITRYDVVPFLKKVQLTGQRNWGVFRTHANWARLFLPELLSPDIDRILYLDGDVVADSSFDDFYNMDLEGCVVAGAEDCIPQQHKAHLGLSSEDVYLNAGVLLFDVNAWRAQYDPDWVEIRLARQEPFVMADQDVLNLMLRGLILPVSLKYNYSVWFRALDLSAIQRLLQSPHLCRYTQNEIRECAHHAVFIHYNTCSLTVRPWYEGATDPASPIWKRWYDASPWAQEPLPPEPSYLSVAEQKDRRLYQSVGKFWFSPLHTAKRFLNSLRHRS